MKRRRLLLPSLISLLLLAGCSTPSEGLPSDSTSTPNSVDSSSEVTKYTITFNSNGGTSVTAITKNSGESINKPTDPTRGGYNFDGWFYDASLTSAVTWPIVLETSLTLYARWVDNRDYFLASRDRTVNGQFEYDFNLNVTTKISAFDGPGALISGKTQYNPTSTTTFLTKEARSGLLIGDGEVYKVRSGDKLLTFKINTEGKLSSYDAEEVDASFKYDTSNFAEALFAYDSDDITSVVDIGNGRFEVKYTSASSLVTSALSFLNHPLVDKIVSLFVNLPSKDAVLSTYVTYQNGFIKKYSYEFSITVSVGTLTFAYDLDFGKVGSGVTITSPSFPGYILTENEIVSTLTSVRTTLNSYKALQNSGYTYRIDTAMKYPQSGFAINATLQGRTMRVLSGGVNYFWNRVKFDSDYKNSDLYKDKIFGDYERYRVRYANGDVYDVHDRVFPLSNQYTKIDNYTNAAIDEFYAFLDPNFFVRSHVNAIELETKGSVKTYSFSLNQTAIMSLLSFVDNTIRTDLNGVYEFKIFNDPTDLTPNQIKLDLIIENDVFKGFDIVIDGALENTYPETIFEGAADFKLKINVSANNEGDTYQAPTKDSEVDLSND